MTNTMLKVTFNLTSDTTRVSLPRDAVIRHVDDQHGMVAIWFEADVAHLDGAVPVWDRYFTTRGTGQPIPDGGVHLGTFKQGPFVWHVFEVPKP
jgi:hypothetical protein